MDNLTPDKRSKVMRAIKSKNTKDEVLLGKALWRRGNRYRKHDKSIFGTPDLSFKRCKIAIFVDSDFFHGRNWDILKLRLNTNKDFWHKKIERNIKRDQEVNQYLASKGWTVLRFWSSYVKIKLHAIVKQIEHAIQDCTNKIYYK